MLDGERPSLVVVYCFRAHAYAPAQELVGFLTESAEMAEDPDDFQVKLSPALKQCQAAGTSECSSALAGPGFYADGEA